MGLSQVAELGRLVSEHFEALESDFQHYYGIDLRQACYGPHPMGLRRLRALIQGLPPGSAVHRSLDPQGSQWTFDTELLAALAELLDHSNRLYLAAHKNKGAQLPRPISIKRPWDTTQEPQIASGEQVKEFFASRGAVK